jgi:hypothetical protein
MKRKNNEKINAKGRYPMIIYAKLGSIEKKYKVIVTAKCIKEFTVAIFQLGERYPRIKFGSKNSMIILTVDNKIKDGINRVKSWAGFKY